MYRQTTNDTVVIIGAGVAGLAAANLLAEYGRRVVVFEASDKVGGCCATTTLNGYTFSDGAVFVTVIGLLDHAFSRIGLKRSELLPLRKIVRPFAATLPDGSTFTMGEGLDVSVTGRTIDLPRLQAELHRMMDKWQPVLHFVSEELFREPFSVGRMLRAGWRHLHKLHGTVAAEMKGLISDPAARAALSGVLLYNGVPADRMPVSAILGLVAQISDGLYLPEGGMGRLPEVLASSLRDRGGTIAVNSTVEKLVVADRRVTGVEVHGKGRIDASAIISTVSGMLTFASLIAAEDVPLAMARKVKGARLSHRAISVQFGLSNRFAAPAHSVNVLPWMQEQQEIFLQDGSELKYPVFVVPTFTMPELAPRGASIIEMFYPIRTELQLAYWDEEKKARLAELSATALSSSQDVTVATSRVRTPKDFAEDMHLYQGALYGLSPSASPWEQFPYESGIAGLVLAGQTTFPGYGVGAAMMSGIFAAEALSQNL